MSRRFTAVVTLAAVFGTAIPLGVNEAVGRYEDAKARAGVIPAKAGPAAIERAFSKMKPLAEQVVGETPDGRPITVRLYSDPSGNLDWSVQLYVVGEPAPVPDPRNPHHVATAQGAGGRGTPPSKPTKPAKPAARRDNPRDVRSFGPRGDGSVSLPGGKRFANTRALVRFLRDNPAYAYKHRSWLMASVPTAFSEAGYVAKPGSAEMQQFDAPVRENQQGGRLIRSWFPEGSRKAQTARQQPESFTKFGTSVTVVGKGGKQTRPADAAPDIAE